MAEHRHIEYVSRAGLKLEHALREFKVDVSTLTCADFGCNVGGFTDCLLQHGAAKVYAIDTGYGVLDWTLRNDPRVVVMERTNALHAAPPAPLLEGEGSSVPIDLVVIDLAWTQQKHSIPAALRWLGPRPSPSESGKGNLIITLIKPHYELMDDERRTLLRNGVLASDEAERVCRRVLEEMPALGVEVRAMTRSPITGGKSAKNVEFLALLRPR
jgi:23S rRNA (cytidine1920-2'-O)/16S rRNA (cytidine1409-2'-O)-methyltransferase